MSVIQKMVRYEMSIPNMIWYIILLFFLHSFHSGLFGIIPIGIEYYRNRTSFFPQITGENTQKNASQLLM